MIGVKYFFNKDIKKSDDSEVDIIIQNKDLEIMFQTLTVNSSVWIEPANDITAIEYFYVVKGKIRLTDEDESILLNAKDSFSCQALTKNVLIEVLEDSEVLYCTNRGMYDELNDFMVKLNTIVDYVDQIDCYTKQHCTHVSFFSSMIYREIEGFEKPEYQDITLASMFLDVGKCYIPKDILTKTGKLTKEEYDEVKKHTKNGYNIIKPLYGESIADIVLNHHEFLDGSGYYGLKGDQISIVNRIITVCDAFDAMISKRTYAKQYTMLEAAQELYDLDDKYDRRVTSKLLELVKNGTIYPDMKVLNRK